MQNKQGWYIASNYCYKRRYIIQQHNSLQYMRYKSSRLLPSWIPNQRYAEQWQDNGPPTNPVHIGGWGGGAS